MDWTSQQINDQRKDWKQFYGKSGMSSDVSEVTGILYEVHVEDTSLSSALVKPENRRIVFVLKISMHRRLILFMHYINF